MRNKYFDHIANLDNLIRFSNKRFVHPRSVAAHLFTVTHMVMIIGDQENLREERKNDKSKRIDMESALRKAVSHDIPESVTGDIIYPIKHYDEEINKKINEIETHAVENEILKYLPTNLQDKYKDIIVNCKQGLEGKLVSLCDLIDVLLYCSIERVLGNQSKWVFDVFEKTEDLIQKYLSEFPTAKKYYKYIRETFLNPSGNKCGEEKPDEIGE